MNVPATVASTIIHTTNGLGNGKEPAQVIRKSYKPSKIKLFWWTISGWWERKVLNPFWYRFFGHRHHIVKTTLPPQSWYDTDTRMLYAVMALVEWFVENDMMAWKKEDREQEIVRIKNDDKSDSEIKNGWMENIVDQFAKEDAIMEIYNWWKNYPNRLDEIDKANKEWHDYLITNKKKDEDFLNMLRRLRVEETVLRDRSTKIEEDLQKEENEMLKKAIELRSCMWS